MSALSRRDRSIDRFRRLPPAFERQNSLNFWSDKPEFLFILICHRPHERGPDRRSQTGQRWRDNLEQLALTVAEACAAARIGRTTLYEAIKCGDLVAAKYGRKTLIQASGLAARFVERLRG